MKFILQSEEVENVRVVVRIRPLSLQEQEKRCKSVVNVDSHSNSVYVLNPNNSQRSVPKCFNFDVVFGPDSNQVFI